MSAKAKFTAADIKRAIAGMASAGFPHGTIRIKPTGEIEILPGTKAKVHDNDEWADLE